MTCVIIIDRGDLATLMLHFYSSALTYCKNERLIGIILHSHLSYDMHTNIF